MSAGADTLRRWRLDPVAFVRENFHVEPDEWQVEGLRAFASDRPRARVAFKASKGVGKTAELAWMVWWFLTCCGDKGAHPKGAATAITGDNLSDNLWPELSKWQQRSPFLLAAFEWTKTVIQARDHPETWRFTARTWPKSGDASQQANSLAGIHAEYTLFVLDESGGIPMAVMAAAEGAMSTGRWARIVQAGNPTHLDGPLYSACTNESHLWDVIEISGAPDDPKRSTRVSVEWANQQIEKYGRDNPWVLVNVFGKFPPQSLNALIGPDEVRAAMQRNPRDADFRWAQKRIGIDVARFGDDSTVLFPRQGIAAFRPVEMRKADTMAIAARVLQMADAFGSEMECIDDTGHWGHGVVDGLRVAKRNVIAVQFHAPAFQEQYKNRRAEMWWTMCDWIKAGGALPNLPELVAELTVPTYTFTIQGQLILEDKDAIKERLGRSPNYADALALTFALPERMGVASPGYAGRASAKFADHDYKPHQRKSRR